ncbi:MAG: transpeptidase family protein [Acidobacteriales bacterium]|nr:transpeptidase family protein [Terriglobales bacterium]
MAAENPRRRTMEPKSSASSSAKKTPNQNRRIYGLIAFLFLWSCLIAVRLFSLQVVRYGEFTQRAARQQQRTVEVSPRRGMIYDRNGHELAMTISVDSVFAVPSEIPDQANAADLIAGVLQTDPREVLARIQSSRNFAWIARKLDATASQRIRGLNLKGIYFQKESKRYYPKSELAAQVLGFVGLDDEGLGGIEKKFDDTLRGRPGKMLVSVDARQRSLGRVEKQPEPGSNIVLTLDEKIQYIAERELERAMQETQSEAGTVVVQDPQTGEILALASHPTFNPNVFHTASPQLLKNRAVSDIYEPGSTFKIVTVAAALQENLAKPEEMIDCQNGSITIFGHRIRDHKPFGVLSVSQIIQQSSDVGAIKLALRLGESRFDQYIRAFGFGSQTGVELPGETRGMAKPANRWTKSSIGSIAMGQEVGVSSVQLASMVSAIANDGVYTPPRIVAGMVAPRTTPTPQAVVFKPAEQRRVISPLTAVQLKKMLEDTVLFGTGKKAILDGYTSAGKTGTAQKVDTKTGRYSTWAHIASFAGFAPVNNPAVTVYVSLDSPRGVHHGGDVAAPLFGRITQQVLAYLNVPHDADVRHSRYLQLRAAAKNADLSEGSPDRLSDTVEFYGDLTADAGPVPALSTSANSSKPTPNEQERAKVIAASFTPEQKTQPRSVDPPMPSAETSAAPAAANGTVILDSEGGRVAPAFLGKSVRSAMVAAQQAGIEIDVIGSGVAREQAPAPGQTIPPGGRVTVRFSR